MRLIYCMTEDVIMSSDLPSAFARNRLLLFNRVKVQGILAILSPRSEIDRLNLHFPLPSPWCATHTFTCATKKYTTKPFRTCTMHAMSLCWHVCVVWLMVNGLVFIVAAQARVSHSTIHTLVVKVTVHSPSAQPITCQSNQPVEMAEVA